MYSIKAKGNSRGEVFIYEDVGSGFFGGVTADQFRKDLRALGDVRAIDVRINSYGGDVFDGLAIYRLLADHPATVTTHVDGIAASIASVIAMAGDSIVMSEAGFLMIHNAWGGVKGDAKEMRDYAERLDAVSRQIAGVYAARSGIDQGEIQQMMNAETWLNSQDAYAKGFANQVVQNEAIAAHCLSDASALFSKYQQRFSRPVPEQLRHPLKEAARARLSLIKK